jgi:hypothetical protein
LGERIGLDGGGGGFHDVFEEAAVEDLEGGEVDEGAEDGDVNEGEDEEAETFGLFGLEPPGDAVIEDAHGEGDADGPADPSVDVEEAGPKEHDDE